MTNTSNNGNTSKIQPTPGHDAHLGLRFWIQLGQVEIAGFRECSGLQIETETEDYIEGGVNTYVHKLPVRVKYSNITLKRGLDAGQDLYRWYLNTIQGRIVRQNISILVYNSTGYPERRWDLQGAFPCKWSGPDLRTEQGAAAIESIEIAHEGLVNSEIGDVKLAAPTFNPGRSS